MENLEKKLKFLEGKREALNSSMISMRIGSSSSYGVMTTKDKLVFVLENLTREHLRTMDASVSHNCGALHIRLPLVTCIARKFLPDHPAHKKCKKCKVMGKYIDIIILEIEKHEK